MLVLLIWWLQGEGAPAADNATLKITVGAGPLGADEWSDEGQMYRIIDQDVVSNVDELGRTTHTFLNLDSF